MDAIKALEQRVSMPLLSEPGPSAEQLGTLFRAATRAPDHAMLRPWRFLVIEGEDRTALGELLVKAALASDPKIDAAGLERIRSKPLRAPTIVVAIACLTEHPKVPPVEQVITAGCAANNIVTAAFALGIGAYWRTGSPAYDPLVKNGLGLANNEQITGFIYLGTPQGRAHRLPEIDLAEYVRRWPAPDTTNSG